MGARFEERHMTVDLQHLENREEIKMAFVGFLNPYIASLVDEEKKYIKIFSCVGRLCALMLRQITMKQNYTAITG